LQGHITESFSDGRLEDSSFFELRLAGHTVFCQCYKQWKNG